MKRLLLIAAAVVVIVGLGVYYLSDRHGSDSNRIVLRQEWFPYSGFAGETAAITLAKHNGVQLVVEAGSESTDPVKVVLSGAAHVGVASVDVLAGAIAKGADLVAIGVINHRTPTCFLVLEKSDIKSFRDFSGHKIGIMPGTNTERVYALVMSRLGISRQNLTEVQVPFDLQTFILGQYDVRPAFIYDEPVSLQKQKVGYRVLDPYTAVPDLAFIGTVYFVERKSITSRREVLVKVLKALLGGWEMAAKSPEQAITTLSVAFPDIDRQREERSLRLGLPFFSGEDGKLLWASEQTWRSTLSALEELSVVPVNSLTVQKIWDPSLLGEAKGNT